MNNNEGWSYCGLPLEDAGWTKKKPVLASHSFPGVYPLFYIVDYDGEMMLCCPNCANRFRLDRVKKAHINYENDYLTCDRCNKLIDSAYGQPEDL